MAGCMRFYRWHLGLKCLLMIKGEIIFHYSHLTLGGWLSVLLLYVYIHCSSRGISRVLGYSEMTIFRLVNKLMSCLKNPFENKERARGDM